jgi:hypothetical protein
MADSTIVDTTEARSASKVELGFPVYAVEYAANTGTIFVAGGGGPAKSGVRNSIVYIQTLNFASSSLSSIPEEATKCVSYPNYHADKKLPLV